MGIFSTGSPFDEDVERVTDEKNTTENWGLIMDICDRAAANPKEALRSIVRRLGHRSPHIQLQTITLLDACINNCGKGFHLEVASREFEQEFRKLVLSRTTHRRVSSRLMASLQKWSETEFKSDPQLSLVPSLYNSLRQFSQPEEPTEKKAPALSRDPNVVSSQQEEEDIAKAIALSMKEAERSPRAGTASSGGGGSLYPTASALTSAPSTSAAPATSEAPPRTERKVRALYDFEAAEENELTFKAGEIVLVTEDSDPNWWMGNNHRGQGLFPSNFVTSDLSEEAEPWKDDRQQRKSVQFNEEVEVKEVEQPQPAEPVSIDENKIAELLHQLNEADPTGERPDSALMLALEEQCLAMGPLIDQELERTDRRHAQLTKISADLVEALNLYHQLMREPAAAGGYFPGPQLKQYGGPPGYYPPMAPPGGAMGPPGGPMAPPGGVMAPPGGVMAPPSGPMAPPGGVMALPGGVMPPPAPHSMSQPYSGAMLGPMPPQYAPGPSHMDPQGPPPPQQQYPEHAAPAPLPPPGAMAPPHQLPWAHYGGEGPPVPLGGYAAPVPAAPRPPM